MFTRHIASNIEIEGSPELVWGVLTDFAGYQEWNPAMVNVAGVPERGERLTITFRREGHRTMTLRPEVLVADPERELRWIGRLVIPWLFDGEHRFTIEPRDDGRVRFVQSESFRGLLVPFLRRMIEVDTVSMFGAVNEALATRVAEVRAERPA